MSNTTTLINRNRLFAKAYSGAELPVIPKLRTVILTCGDSRVDPAHVFGLDLGDAVVIRNNGGRVTPEVIEELAAMAFIVAQMDGDDPAPFELVIMQHTHCGAERFADPAVQRALQNIGIDVSSVAIADHEQSLRDDIDRLRAAPLVPDHILVSGFIYEVELGHVREVIAPVPLGSSQTQEHSRTSELPRIGCNTTQTGK